MPTLLDPKLRRALRTGAIWERTRDVKHERHIRIVKSVNAALGRRFLVQGLASGRQWTISPPLLLGNYKPIPKGMEPTRD